MRPCRRIAAHGKARFPAIKDIALPCVGSGLGLHHRLGRVGIGRLIARARMNLVGFDMF